jgi:hypothetical protein
MPHGLLGLTFLVVKWRGHATTSRPNQHQNQHQNQPFSHKANFFCPVLLKRTMATQPNFVEECKDILKLPTSDEKSVKIWKLRCREGTLSALEGKYIISTCHA